MLNLKDFNEFKVQKLDNVRGGKHTATILNGSSSDVTTQIGGDCILTSGGDAWVCDSNCNHCS